MNSYCIVTCMFAEDLPTAIVRAAIWQNNTAWDDWDCAYGAVRSRAELESACVFVCDPQSSHEGPYAPGDSRAFWGLVYGMSVWRMCTVGRSPIPVSSMPATKLEEIEPTSPMGLR